MGKGKPLVSKAVLVTALLFSGHTVAFAKGPQGSGNPAQPNVNLGLAAILKNGVGVGLQGPAVPAMPSLSGPPTLPPSAAASAISKPGPALMPTIGQSASPAVGNGAAAQSAAPGAAWSASSAGLMPPGHNNPPGVRTGHSHSSYPGNDGGGADNSKPSTNSFPPGPATPSDVGSGAVPESGQGEGQGSGASQNAPSAPVTPVTSGPELLAAAQYERHVAR